MDSVHHALCSSRRRVESVGPSCVLKTFVMFNPFAPLVARALGVLTSRCVSNP